MKQKQEIQYRYYEMPTNSYIIALLGSSWIRPYGLGDPHLHYHNYMEIGYCLSGTGRMLFGKTVHQYSAGCFTLIPANYPHNTIATPDTNSHWEYLFIDTKSFINDMYYNNSKMRLNLHGKIENQAYFFDSTKEQKIAKLILMIMDTYRSNEELYQEISKGLLLSLIVSISRLTHYFSENLLIEGSDTKAVIGALHFVELNYKNNIKISDLAEECHISETHFRRIFKQAMGISPLAYVNLFRIEAACRKIRTTNERISDIALQCGFSSQPSFNQIFKALVGVTPTQWRKDTELGLDSLKKQNIIAFNSWQ